MLLKDAGLSGRTVTALAKKKVYTADDLMRVVPNKFRDYRHPCRIVTEAMDGTYVAVRGVMESCEKKESNGKRYMVMRLSLDMQRVRVTTFQNLYLYSTYASYVQCEVVICGKLSYDPQYGFSMSSPDIVELASRFRPRMYTIYPNWKGISDSSLRDSIRTVLKTCKDPLAKPVREMADKNGVMDYRRAMESLHYPSDPESVMLAQESLTFHDLLYFADRFRETSDIRHTSFAFPEGNLVQRFISGLPYALTKDQQMVIGKLMETARDGGRINALIQGDVGSGKTVVATALMINAVENGFQAVLTAPREVLALQHYKEISRVADGLGISTVFLHSGMKASERKKAYADIESGKVSLIIGTHSCMSEAVAYHALALVITDEEHLFGVAQKEALSKKAAGGVHVISMSATPIPRTLAGVLYGESKEILSIKTMPAGRIPIQTATQLGHRNAFPFLLDQIRAGHQGYVVCPAIDSADEEKTGHIMSLEEAEVLYRRYFEPYGVRIAVLNGRMKPAEVEEVTAAFTAGKNDIILSTTVIEVGVNNPNATVIIIEQAERFGLASLHQLRGRVGRGQYPSYCILISPEPDNARLSIMKQTTDGFKIAEEDLQLRGAGNLIGEEQTGFDRFVDEMLLYPDIYEAAKKIVARFSGTRYLDGLTAIYREHEEAAS